MTDRESETRPPRRLRQDARSIYGTDAEGYAAGRPDYPDAVYQALEDRCGLRAGTLVMEIGPGTGLVSRHLLEFGASVVAVEPDRVMAAYLAERFREVEILNDTFEQADLRPDSFDLAVAANSFHWVEQATGIPKLRRILRPGGWAALWWTIFDDPEREDPFRDELASRFGEQDPGKQRRAEFQMDHYGRLRDLQQLGGFEEVKSQVYHWSLEMDSTQLRALYGSMINVHRRPAPERRRLLDDVVAVSDRFGGTVQRAFVTVLYTGRKRH